jgi:hypothetical protein
MGIKEDLQKYQLYVYENRKLIPIEPIESWNMYKVQIHHFIKQQQYKRNPQWFKDRGIEQKLFLISVKMHEDLEVYPIDNDKFYNKYGVKRSDMLFNKKWSTY